MRRAAVTTTMIVALTAAREAAAQGAIDTRVSFDAPATCPDRNGFERELRFRTARINVVDGAASTTAGASTASVEVTIALAAGRYTAKLLVRDGGATTRRSFQGPQCASLVGALALTAAILLDPEGARTDASPEPADTSSQPTTEPAAPPAEPPPPVPPSPSPPPASSIPPAPAPTAPPKATMPAPAPKPIDLTLGVAGGVTTAIESFDPVASIRAEVRRATGEWRPTASLLVHGSPGHDVARAAGIVRYAGGAAELSGCPHVFALGASFSVTGCLMAGTWLVRANAPSAVIDVPSTRALAVMGLELRVERRFGDGIVGLELSSHAHLLRERFRIEPQGEVFRLPTVYVSAGISGALTIL